MRCAKRSRFRSLDDDGPVVVERQHGPEDEVTYPSNVALRLNELVSRVERVHGQAKEMMVQFVFRPQQVGHVCWGRISDGLNFDIVIVFAHDFWDRLGLAAPGAFSNEVWSCGRGVVSRISLKVVMFSETQGS